METVRFQRAVTDVGHALLSKIIDEILREKEATRNAVALATGASATSVRKVFSALSLCGFTEEVCRPQKNGAKPCGHLYLKETASVLVLDLSAPIYGIALIGSDCRCIFYEQFVYDRNATFYDNLIILLSRARLLLKKSHTSFSAIGVICADRALTSIHTIDPALPNVSQHKEELDALIRKMFGVTPTLYAELSEAFGCALRYNLLPTSSGACNSAYVFLGSELYALGLPDGRNPIPIRLSGLMPTSTAQLQDHSQDLSSKYGISNILWRTVNLLECMMRVDLLVVESDHEKFDVSSLSSIRKILSIMGLPEPNLIARAKAPSIAATALSRACIADLMLRHLTPTSKPEKEEGLSKQ